MMRTLSDIIPILQGAIGPALSFQVLGIVVDLTNRFAGILDRATVLAAELRAILRSGALGFITWLPAAHPHVEHLVNCLHPSVSCSSRC